MRRPGEGPGIPANEHAGKRIFVEQGCYQCHGYAGQGSPMTGPALAGLTLSEDAVVDYVRHPGGVMPAFSVTILPQDQARELAGYVLSLGQGRPPSKIALLAPYVVGMSAAVAAKRNAGDVRSDRAGDAPMPTSSVAARAPESGSALYAANCAMCHGENLEGGIGPDLRSEPKKRSVDQIAALIMAPPAAMPTLYPAPLDAGRVKAVAAFVHGSR
ncbi:c-type cytochrome [Sphingomonas oligophenolica]|uniref:c-type cytochrome n=1 Tax=Sphingomonas oligophenolica TaxID=301154 RepID=UPI00138753B3|nr:c-type cytochrome [Sphingomonas oligophenolica]